MGKYGKVAKTAVSLLRAEKAKGPIDAWEIAVHAIFPDSKSSRKKSCPRSTFLSLCESGYIAGAKEGKYTKSVKNKNYAIEALKLLATNQDLLHDSKCLWERVLDGEKKQQNSQMDVVISLWQNDMIHWERL